MAEDNAASGVPNKLPGGASRAIKLSQLDSLGSSAVWHSPEERRLAEERLEKMTSAYQTLIECLEDDKPERKGLEKTPYRAAKALLYFTKGYEEDIESEACQNLIS